MFKFTRPSSKRPMTTTIRIHRHLSVNDLVQLMCWHLIENIFDRNGNLPNLLVPEIHSAIRAALMRHDHIDNLYAWNERYLVDDVEAVKLWAIRQVRLVVPNIVMEEYLEDHSREVL